MRDRDMVIGGDRGRGRGRRRTLVVALLVLLVLGAVALAWWRTGTPTAELATDLPGIGPRTEVVARVGESGRGLGALLLELEQEGERWTLLERQHEPRPWYAFWGARTTEDVLEAEVGHQVQPELAAGQATLRLVAERAGSWLRRPEPLVVEAILPVKTRPPTLGVLSDQVYLRQGGSGVVLYRTDPSATTDGVAVADRWFPGHALPGDASGARFAFFGAPFDLEEGSSVRLVARDELGNEAEQRFLTAYRPSPPRESTIQLSDAFMERVVPAIVAQSSVTEQGSLLDTYLAINRDLRRENDARLVELAERSRDAFLWSEPFLQQPNTQVMDAFASRRRYLYEGEVVDRQTHLGYDLASRRRDEVIASNRGVVLLAEYFGIYGNTVILDHGFGLMTLYAHLSTIEVAPGEEVERRQVLGRSGETGLAGGDHLHFSVLVHGMPVDPVEWWDPKWIADRIAPHLEPAFQFER